MISPRGLAARLRSGAAALGVGAARDWMLDRYALARLERAIGRDRPPRAARAAEPQPPFLGDPARWVQTADWHENAGDHDLGWGAIRRSAASRAVWSRPSGHAFAGGSTTIACHETRDTVADEPPGPHRLCEVEHLAIDFSRLYPARTLRHRPRYAKGSGRQYHRYRDGALSAACHLTPEFQIERFPRDHQRDFFDSLRVCAGTAPGCEEVVEHPVLFVTREGEETRNLFHATTEFMSAFEAVQIANAGPHTDAIGRDNLEVVLLDNAPTAPFDPLWARVFAPVRGVRRVGDFSGRRVLFRRAVFSAPGYQSRLFAFLLGEGHPLLRVGFLDGFAGLVQRAHGINPLRRPIGGPLRLTLVSRRPYATHEQMLRQTRDEAACVDGLNAIDGVEARAIDFARLPIGEQIRIASETDLLVGAHGAALTHQLWMPACAGVLEIIDPARAWNVFRNLAGWTSREYASMSVQEHPIRSGSEIAIDRVALAVAVRDLASRVAQRRASD